MRSDQILHRTLKHGDELALLEVGKRVEEDQFFESSRHPLTTLGDILKTRYFIGRNAILRWEKRNDYAQQDRENTFLRADGMPAHGIECPCEPCDRGYKRLLWDVLGLPRRVKA